MKTMQSIVHTVQRTGRVAVICLASLITSGAHAIEPMIDNFDDPNANSLGFARLYIDDTTAGGQTSTQYSVDNGVLSAKGEIQPPRGQPGWASTVFLLNPEGLPQDASAYEGVRLLVRINRGNLSVSANSSEVENFDYHAAVVTRQPGSSFHEVRIPFSSMKRAWSEQTELNTGTLTSLSLVAYDMQPGNFDFEVDEVSFY